MSEEGQILFRVESGDISAAAGGFVGSVGAAQISTNPDRSPCNHTFDADRDDEPFLKI